jgi:hypothetical protein
MLIKSFKDEDFVNYKKPAMFIVMPHCSFKCDKENNCLMCQNSHLAHEPTHNVAIRTLIERYINNPITKAIVFGGLEPFDTPEDLEMFVKITRWTYECKDDIVIYTGYTEEELSRNLHFQSIISCGNIIIKYGRFRPNQDPHYDEVLGVNLASDNQYAKRYNYEL